ncbi:MAG TPA: hypothetical protein PK497_05870 [Burkholderiaceae bacterium]|nr:hypothetical protein [Burkholderiaceae bacterium]
MYSAPAVSYPAHRSRVQLYVIVGLWLAGACVWLFWQLGVGVTGWRQVLTFAVLVATGAAATLAWRRTPVGHLRWDLSTWVWTDADSVSSGMTVVYLDFQAFLLLKYVGNGGSPRWLWLERQTALRNGCLCDVPCMPATGQLAKPLLPLGSWTPAHHDRNAALRQHR